MIASTIATPMRALCATVIAVGIVLAALPASAADLPKAEKRENVIYYSVLYIAFKPGKSDEGYKLIYDHLVPAGKKAGNPATIIDFQTGPWDSAAYFRLTEGPAAFNWITSPRTEAFWAALAEQEGGAEKAQALFARYTATLARTKTELAHRHIEAKDSK